MPAAIKHTKTTSSRSALLILIVANFSSRSSRYTPPPSFAEVEVSVPTTATAGSGQIGIELPSGVRITVDAAVDADALARVMSVLAR